MIFQGTRLKYSNPIPLTPFPWKFMKGRGECSERGRSPLSQTSSPSPSKERGIKGVR